MEEPRDHKYESSLFSQMKGKSKLNPERGLQAVRQDQSERAFIEEKKQDLLRKQNGKL